jgi:putative flippase GtrA
VSRPHAARVVIFNGVGALGVGVQLVTVGVLVDEARVPVLIATALGVSAAVIHNFIWHWWWTWNDRRPASVGGAFARFATANGALSLAGNLLVVSGLQAYTRLSAPAANFVAIAVCGVANYLLSDRLVFAERQAIL